MIWLTDYWTLTAKSAEKRHEILSFLPLAIVEAQKGRSVSGQGLMERIINTFTFHLLTHSGKPHLPVSWRKQKVFFFVRIAFLFVLFYLPNSPCSSRTSYNQLGTPTYSCSFLSPQSEATPLDKHPHALSSSVAILLPLVNRQFL